ncbi:MAG: BlaI/MecI/CopY family transcriptional regulator [Planctomycetes bacterium]|nr:BlaI/MecI/CopY family transcriptional regulator [Planctomycetota bacterium]
MARRQSRTLTDVELEFMQLLWSKGKVSTDDIQSALRQQGRDLTDGSIRKVLSILVRKSYVQRRRVGRAFLYEAKVDEQAASRSFLRDLVTRVFGGSAALLVAALLDTRSVRPKDIEAIKRLIAEREREKDQ